MAQSCSSQPPSLLGGCHPRTPRALVQKAQTGREPAFLIHSRAQLRAKQSTPVSLSSGSWLSFSATVWGPSWDCSACPGGREAEGP